MCVCLCKRERERKRVCVCVWKFLPASAKTRSIPDGVATTQDVFTGVAVFDIYGNVIGWVSNIAQNEGVLPTCYSSNVKAIV